SIRRQRFRRGGDMARAVPTSGGVNAPIILAVRGMTLLACSGPRHTSSVAETRPTGPMVVCTRVNGRIAHGGSSRRLVRRSFEASATRANRLVVRRGFRARHLGLL